MVCLKFTVRDKNCLKARSGKRKADDQDSPTAANEDSGFFPLKSKQTDKSQENKASGRAENPE